MGCPCSRVTDWNSARVPLAVMFRVISEGMRVCVVWRKSCGHEFSGTVSSAVLRTTFRRVRVRRAQLGFIDVVAWLVSVSRATAAPCACVPNHDRRDQF
jgi:hypothetical protein